MFIAKLSVFDFKIQIQLDGRIKQFQIKHKTTIKLKINVHKFNYKHKILHTLQSFNDIYEL